MECAGGSGLSGDGHKMAIEPNREVEVRRIAKGVEQRWSARDTHAIGQGALNDAVMIGGSRVRHERHNAALEMRGGGATRRRGRGILGEVGRYG